MADDHGGGLDCVPRDARAGALVHFHGGGFVTGSPWTHRCVGAWLAHVLRRIVWLCPYPLAPETTLPRQADTAALRLWQARIRFGDGLILSGDSAGALLALWAFARSGAALRPAVEATLLFYGYFGRVPVTGPERDGLGPASVRAMQDRLDPEGRMPGDAMLDPLHKDFPLPTRTVALGAARDPLLENTRALATAHPDVRVLTAQGLGHGFLSTPTQTAAGLAEVRRLSDLLR
ncbi:alpha/beta hydrolase [Psychromarinibacter sp. C21-152]|uniref:Alpha/beta hydrolase n=1 Tax=Psychromarinibacter sediminicola TaxID=3033385 RepID=A0AAE3T8C2_9RHOB|nr:alpha/beta hydrolase [Psychromarinibacter sediminicola]MDF0600548.1 alpha/beta hydrolase [Psychromarinibacter sediminicola]